MIRLATAALLLAVALPAQGQSPADATQGHVLTIRDGALALDGRLLPDAIPDALDLTGFDYYMEFSGPVTPVLIIDNEPYVFENERLVPFDESSRVGEKIYGLANPGAAPQSRAAGPGDAAYMQQVAARDEALYRQMRHERTLEQDALLRAQRIRQMPEGAARDAAREELRDLLSDLLRLKDANRREELARMQERVDAVRAQLDQRSAMHDEIVDARLQSLCDK